MIKRVFYRVASRLVLHPFYRLTRGMTLGVRVAVFDGAGGVLLVRHTYAPGWLLPGGGVERGETLTEAGAREIREEGGIIAEAPLAFHGMFLNHANFPGDHVAVFALHGFSRQAWSPGLEIAEAAFFPLGNLPQGTTGGTRRRIAEMTQGRPGKKSGDFRFKPCYRRRHDPDASQFTTTSPRHFRVNGPSRVAALREPPLPFLIRTCHDPSC